MNEVETKKKRVSVIIIGSHHSDHGPTIMTFNLMKQLTKLGLKLFYCAELEEDQTLEQKTQRDKQCARTTQIDMGQPFVSNNRSPADTTHARPYFSYQSISKIEIEYKNLYPKMPIQEVQMRSGYFRRYHNLVEKVRLNEYLNSAKIPFQGLEQSAKERAETVRLIYQDHQNMAVLEQKRIDHITAVFFNKVLPNTNTGTVIICNVGGLHSHRFAAHILERGESMGDQLPYDLHVIPIACFSNYISQEEQKLLLDQVHVMRQQDKADIVEYYKKLPPLKAITLTETKDGNHFESEEFCKIFQEAAMFAKPPKMYFIPSTDTTLITSQGGNVLQAKNNGLYASFHSCNLTAEKRTALGIDRKLLTLDENCAEKLELLRSRKEFIVIEETCIHHKFLVTFPQSELDFVTKVASKDWRKLLTVNAVQPELKGKDLK